MRLIIYEMILNDFKPYIGKLPHVEMRWCDFANYCKVIWAYDDDAFVYEQRIKFLGIASSKLASYSGNGISE